MKEVLLKKDRRGENTQTKNLSEKFYKKIKHFPTRQFSGLFSCSQWLHINCFHYCVFIWHLLMFTLHISALFLLTIKIFSSSYSHTSIVHKQYSASALVHAPKLGHLFSWLSRQLADQLIFYMSTDISTTYGGWTPTRSSANFHFNFIFSIYI